MPNYLQRFKSYTRSLKQQIHALYYTAKDPRTPWLPKLVIGMVVAYALSPIDLIPDFIPVLGHLDDLLLVPLGILLAIKLIPAAVWADAQQQAAATETKLAKSRSAAAVIIAIWIVCALLTALWLLRKLESK